MALAHVLYASRSTDTERLTVGKILSAAHRFNTPNDITGLLLFDGVHYLQLLEGSRAVISGLYHRIAADPRHEDIVLLSAGEMPERQCPAWVMGYVDDRDVVRAAVRRFSGSSTFDPYTMSSESAMRLLRHCATTSGSVRTSSAVG